MNLIIKDQRQFLPKDKRTLIEHKEKLLKYKGRIAVIVSCCMVVVVGLILFPQIIQKITPIIASSYIEQKIDPIITQGFKIKVIKGKDIATALQNNNIQNPQIASQPQLGELIVKPVVNEQQVKNADSRVLILHKFLVSQGSPMAGSAATFVNVADKYKFDWRLMPSIAGTESGFGKIIPLQANGSPSYNAFGFGVYGGTFISFKSWDDAIQTIGDSLARTYGVANLKPAIMEESYTPPSYFGDHHWRRTVMEFMSEL